MCVSMTTILIVDDEPDIRALLRFVLERVNFTVLEAGNGAEALALCVDHTPDLVLTDLLMPKMSGAAMLQHMMDKGMTSKAIVMSGGSLGGDPNSEVSKARAIGVCGMIAKPFDPADVVKLCLEAIESP